MTTATCIYCGTLKFGAFVPCHECGRTPQLREEAIRSFLFTDHFFTQEELVDFGILIKGGHQPVIDSHLQSKVADEIDDDMIDALAKSSDPKVREYNRRRERTIILVIISLILAAMGWMIHRFAIG